MISWDNLLKNLNASIDITFSDDKNFTGSYQLLSGIEGVGADWWNWSLGNNFVETGDWGHLGALASAEKLINLICSSSSASSIAGSNVPWSAETAINTVLNTQVYIDYPDMNLYVYFIYQNTSDKNKIIIFLFQKENDINTIINYQLFNNFCNDITDFTEIRTSNKNANNPHEYPLPLKNPINFQVNNNSLIDTI